MRRRTMRRVRARQEFAQCACPAELRTSFPRAHRCRPFRPRAGIPAGGRPSRRCQKRWLPGSRGAPAASLGGTDRNQSGRIVPGPPPKCSSGGSRAAFLGSEEAAECFAELAKIEQRPRMLSSGQRRQKPTPPPPGEVVGVVVGGVVVGGAVG